MRCKDRESTGQAVVKAVHGQSCDGLCLGSRGLGATLQGAFLSAVGTSWPLVPFSAQPKPFAGIPPHTWNCLRLLLFLLFRKKNLGQDASIALLYSYVDIIDNIEVNRERVGGPGWR